MGASFGLRPTCRAQPAFPLRFAAPFVHHAPLPPRPAAPRDFAAVGTTAKRGLQFG
jgi:hypothetical protein